MINSFDDLFNLFIDGLTPWENNQYSPKIRFFLKYLNDNKRRTKTVDSLFREELTPQDIVDSCVQYVLEKDNRASKTIVNDYLIAFNQFFESILVPYYPNQNLISKKSFNYLFEIIVEEIEKVKKLKDTEKFLPVRFKQYRFILSYIRSIKKNDAKILQINIILRLLLMYGFSFTRIKDMKVDNFNDVTKTLSIYLNRSEKYVHLELPYDLAIDISMHINTNKNDNTNYLFFNDDFTQIEPYFTHYFIRKMREQYAEKENNTFDDKRFTNTGFAMYAIVNMLESMDQSVIMELTDMGYDIIQTCQNELNSRKKINLNRYINASIRSIDTFDDFQKALLVFDENK